MRTLIEGGWVVAFNGKSHEVYEQGSQGRHPYKRTSSDRPSYLAAANRCGYA